MTDTATATKQKHKGHYKITRRSETEFTEKGLRTVQVYRDLGMDAASGGDVRVLHIKAKGGGECKFGFHTHSVNHQMVYVLKGWVRMQCRGHPEELLKEGDIVHMVGTDVHDVFEISEDFEALEIMMPASFETNEADE
jgi:quercetin dioxygenase-like cupin family protein